VSTQDEHDMVRIPKLKIHPLESRDAVELLAQKWRITVLHLLSSGALRNSQLQGATEQISPKVLTQTLRGLERDGLIERTVYAVVPPRVEYSLTDMGRSVLRPLADLCHWAKAHVGQRDAARKRFDSGIKQR
jgi:DNA-binding HxlR family transcriptional regulator